MTFKITSRAIDPVELKRSLETDSAGACVTFEGWVRDHNDGAPVVALTVCADAAGRTPRSSATVSLPYVP